MTHVYIVAYICVCIYIYIYIHMYIDICYVHLSSCLPLVTFAFFHGENQAVRKGDTQSFMGNTLTHMVFNKIPITITILIIIITIILTVTIIIITIGSPKVVS